MADRPYDLKGELQKLRDLAHEVALGPSTAAIVEAARKRGIPHRRLNSGSLIQLGQGARQRRILTAETDRTGAIAESIAQDKELTRTPPHRGGRARPRGEAGGRRGGCLGSGPKHRPSVVVKPRYGNHGRGVATNLSTREQVCGGLPERQGAGG